MSFLKSLSFAVLAATLGITGSCASAATSLTPESRDNVKWWKPLYEQQVKELKNKPCDVLFLGDSITNNCDKAAKKVCDTILKPYNPRNFGISGDRTGNLIYRITDSGLPAKTEPKLCIIMIGTNNTGIHKCAEAPEATAMGIMNVAQHLLVRFPKTHVIVLGIFPRGQTAQEKMRVHNDKINAILAKCALPRTSYVNINDKFLDAKGNLLPGLFPDKLHPSEKGHEVWAKAMLPYIKKYCGK